MGQENAYEYLKANKGKWLTTKQVSEGIGVVLSTASANLKKLRRRKIPIIDFRYVGGDRRKGIYRGFIYTYKEVNNDK